MTEQVRWDGEARGAWEPPGPGELGELLAELAAIGKQCDVTGAYPSQALRLLHGAGFARLGVPVSRGGSAAERWPDTFAPIIRAALDIARADMAIAEAWVTSLVMGLRLVSEHKLGAAAERELARSLLEGSARVVPSISEPRGAAPTVARAAAGGMVVSGTKAYNVNSGGEGAVAEVLCTMSESEERRFALVPLTSSGVQVHDDWRSVGQRATGRQTVVYHDVFVPDGWFYTAAAPSPFQLPASLLIQAALLAGAGLGALDAAVDCARLAGASAPAAANGLAGLAGGLLVPLRAAEALVLATTQQMAGASQATDMHRLHADSVAAKFASLQAAAGAAARVFELTGTEGTRSEHRLDRFLRNIETFAALDPTNATVGYLGEYLLRGPDATSLAFRSLAPAATVPEA
jgi:alkylation response protein AidB-like acyl-CoA dehydrogenase